jgi:hypothetical protein
MSITLGILDPPPTSSTESYLISNFVIYYLAMVINCLIYANISYDIAYIVYLVNYSVRSSSSIRD